RSRTPTRTEVVGPPWLARGRIPCLDGLRAVSIGLVVLAHAAGTHGSPVPRSWREACHRLGPLGGDVFFVLSGFLITLLRLREVGRTGTVSLCRFYWRRALRILPAYLAYLAFLAALSAAGTVRLGRGDWLSALTYTVNLRPRLPAHEVAHIWS